MAIHEAGHAVASHVYMQDVLSTRLSIRMRGGSLGHHQAIEKEERFSSWRHEEVGKLVWTLGAMAAEHVFYGENSRRRRRRRPERHRRARRGWSASCGMGPEPIDLTGSSSPPRRSARGRAGAHGALRAHRPADHEPRAPAARVRRRDRRGPRRPAKRRAAAQILGQAYITALCLHPPQPRADRSDRRDARRAQASSTATRSSSSSTQVGLEAPAIDVTDETIWPKL